MRWILFWVSYYVLHALCVFNYILKLLFVSGMNCDPLIVSEIRVFSRATSLIVIAFGIFGFLHM